MQQNIRNRLSVLTGVVLAGMLTLGAGTAHAGPTYCNQLASDPSDDRTTNVDKLSTSDMTFRGLASDDCYGVVTGDNVDSADLNSLWGGGWDALLKDDSNKDGTTTYLGLTWTLSAPNDTNDGNWTLNVTDNSSVSGGFPVTVDLVGVLKASNSWAAYLFTAQLFAMEGTNTGTFLITFENGGRNLPNLSGLTLGIREAPTTVPEPTSLLLLAMGFGAVACSRRVQRRRSEDPFLSI